MSPQQRTEMSHKERLLRQGMKHFYAYGYHGTTVDSVLAASGVPKGSFYHHFGSKEAFGKAVLNLYMQYQLNLLHKWIEQSDLPTPEKLTGYFDEMAGEFIKSGYQRACLAGKFSTEVSATSETFRVQLDSDLRDWRAFLVTALARGQERGDIRKDRSPEELADALLALMQGAFVIALSSRNEESLRAVSTTIPLLVGTSPAAM
ncbi:TetR/AcrR family transcriptional regulator [Streptomyces diastatochromogenes]|uniref:TetR/AcrR family transcriptional regulator n=1 Tax=Streptomyces diastatochromogenes TaxID=42236 RepID=UPI0036CEBC2E